MLDVTSKTRGWLTPDSIPDTTTCYTIQVPDSIELRSVVRGAISLLGQVENWEQFGDVTPEEIAEFFAQNYFTYQRGNCPMIGEIKIWPSATIPDGWLLCDGSLLERSEYPELFDVIGTLYGSDSGDDFRIPDMVGRFVVGTDVSEGFSLAGSGGSLEHLHQYVFNPLTTANLTNPSFVGYEGSQTNVRAFAGGGSSTIQWLNRSTGTHLQAHLPPFIVLNFIISAG